MKYTFTVEDEGEVVFRSETASFDRIQEEIARFERHIKEGYKAVQPGVYIK